jgi:formate hydrogenlyase subunit 4
MNVLVLPWGLGHANSLLGGLQGIGALVGKLAVCGILIVIIDSSFAKLRFFRIAEYLGGSFLLALIGIITGYVIRR